METEKSLEMKLLEKEMEKLDEWKRILLLMRAQNFSYEEISKYVNKPADQLKVYYLRIKKQLTENINNHLAQVKND